MPWRWPSPGPHCTWLVARQPHGLYQSGQTNRRGRITKRGNRQARWALTLAANALLRARRPSALRDWGLGLAARVGRKKAVVAVARKLAALLWAMWRHEMEFEPRLVVAA